MIKLLKVLKDRGSITETEYQMLVDAAQAEAKAAQAPTVTALPPATSVAATPPAATIPATPGSTNAQKPATAKAESTAKPDPAFGEALKQSLKDKWYERLGVRGYVQLRYSRILDNEGADLFVPNDGSVSETSSFLIRRGRVILSGDATERLFVYAQADLNGSISTGDFVLSMRDYYADLAFDKDKEYRVRLGQSKVPFGWVNLQSSQNRAPAERPDALNNAVEGERDIGAFFYWAPKETRQIYRDLVRSGLKGSGDYGVAGVGAYSGQGLNRLDLNGEPHLVARFNYPWKLQNGQYIEAGVQGYHGKFVSPVSSINLNGTSLTPTRAADGVVDQRAGGSFIWYPQPFGVEAEWNIGRGPELNRSSGRIESELLHGGYVQIAYRIDKNHGDWYPFARWQYFDGGRKFASNAPHSRVHEFDIGLEWQPWTEFEIMVSYTHTFDRTNTRVSPYNDSQDSNRLTFQAQFNF